MRESDGHGRGGSHRGGGGSDGEPVCGGGGAAAGEPPAEQQIDLSKVSARTNLNETAFFFPTCVSDKDGRVTMKFTMPEALTEWKFMGFAHDSQMRGGSISDTAVTSKDLMVEPLPPRFVREGDVLEFTVKVTNQSPTRQAGTVRLTLSDARTLEPVDDQLDNTNSDRSFDIPSQAVRELLMATAGPRRHGIPDLQGGRFHRPSVRRRGRLPAGALAAHPGDRIAAAADPRCGTKKFEFTNCWSRPTPTRCRHQSLTVQMVFATGLVCRAGSCLT